jgi:hypothetical protein
MLRLSEETYKLLCELGGHNFDDGMVQYDLWDIKDSYRRSGLRSVFKTEELTYASRNGQLTHGWFPTFMSPIS